VHRVVGDVVGDDVGDGDVVDVGMQRQI